MLSDPRIGKGGDDLIPSLSSRPLLTFIKKVEGKGKIFQDQPNLVGPFAAPELTGKQRPSQQRRLLS